MESNGEMYTVIGTVWMVSREYDGLAGAGGVKDVCRQLAESLVAEEGVTVTVILPRYGFMDADGLGFTPMKPCCPWRPALCRSDVNLSFAVDMHYPNEERREKVSIWERHLKGVRVLLVEADRFAEKNGVYTYTAEEEARHPWQQQGSGHYDYFAMNILLQKAAMELMILLDERPDIIHCQDGHAATMAAMIRENPGYRHYFMYSGVIVTIHNAGLGYHQDVADLSFARAITGLPEAVIHRSRLGNSFDPFVAAAGYAIMNTVSENYARELQETKEDARTGWLGHRLLKRGVQLEGVTNGINPAEFDPVEPEKLGLTAAFAPINGEFDGKRSCKHSVLTEFSRHAARDTVTQHGRLSLEPELPLFTFIGRLTAQKGVDVLLRSLDLLWEDDTDFQVLVLGSGDKLLEKQVDAVTRLQPVQDRICFLKGYDPALANRVYAAGDFFLIPSLYEPCGLTDYIAQLLGNLPIVHHVGGLVKVEDGVTGFTYGQHSPTALAGAMRRALAAYRDNPDQVRNMQVEAVQRIYERHTWKNVMSSYIKLYGQALAMTSTMSLGEAYHEPSIRKK